MRICVLNRGKSVRIRGPCPRFCCSATVAFRPNFDLPLIFQHLPVRLIVFCTLIDQQKTDRLLWKCAYLDLPDAPNPANLTAPSKSKTPKSFPEGEKKTGER